MLFYILFITAGILLDQMTKFIAANVLKPVSTIPIIPHVFHLTYVENRGAAFSLLSGKQTLLIVLTGISIMAILYFFMQVPKTRRYFYLNLALAMLISGSIGNFIDRIRLQYVVDFFDFRLIGFAIFNVADIFVVIGCFLLIISLYKHPEVLDNKPIGAKDKRKAGKKRFKNPFAIVKAGTKQKRRPPSRKRSPEDEELRKKLEPNVSTKIVELPGHYTPVTFNPTPPPKKPEMLRKKQNNNTNK